MSLIGAETFNWEDGNKRNNIMYRMPRNIKFNDNIVVREDEIAVFYRDGKALAYLDRPDRYALTSLNAPVIGKVIEALSGARQQAEVIYLQKRAFDGKYGSKQPYQFRDAEFGMVNLRVFGEFRYKVGSPESFVNQFVGTFNFTTSAEVEERIKEQMVMLIYNAIGELKNRGMGVADLASQLMNIEQIVLTKAKDHFELYGVVVDKVSGMYISLPDEVQKAVDMRASMQILNTSYATYQAGQAMREAASNPAGGAAAAGVGVGAGFGAGYMMVDAMRQGGTAPPAGAPAVAVPPVAGTVACPKCSTPNPQGAKFCRSCGNRLQNGTVKCGRCGSEMPADSKFCAECGQQLKGSKSCPKCGKESPVTAKFCPECGTGL
ncbi:MAG TPA: SPFH domain-containing protein [Methanomassiliicoccales archaeon]|nr:SPFH domain-containing protein [Methanomassiliicoccales archaeon]HQM66630.1 SPFH domain-containing protein [Methanomassiliicoccales archaeon]